METQEKRMAELNANQAAMLGAINRLTKDGEVITPLKLYYEMGLRDSDTLHAYINALERRGLVRMQSDIGLGEEIVLTRAGAVLAQANAVAGSRRALTELREERADIAEELGRVLSAPGQPLSQGAVDEYIAAIYTLHAAEIAVMKGGTVQVPADVRPESLTGRILSEFGRDLTVAGAKVQYVAPSSATKQTSIGRYLDRAESREQEMSMGMEA